MPDDSLTSHDTLLDVLAVTRALTAEVDLDALLVMIMDSASRLLHAERSTLYLLEWGTHQLVSRIAQQSEVQELRFPIGLGLAGTTAATGEMINIPNAYVDSRFNQAFDRATGFRTREVLVVPVSNSRRERIGVIQVMNSHRGVFTSEDVAVLEALASSAGVALENARLYERIEGMLESFIQTLAASIDARDPQTAGHSHRVASYATQVARELQVPLRHQKLIYLSGMLHDYGKIGVPELILTKPSRLSDAEMNVMRSHSTMSHDILARVAFTEGLRRIPDLVFQHHERVDGRGYPRGLKGDEIEFEARILAVCDVFDALTSPRYYRDPITQGNAFGYIRENSGSHFEPDVVKAFGAILQRDGSISAIAVAPDLPIDAGEVELAGRM